jgi:Lrp/AsnC family transcriptional regulator for asnA, asnC and gidA
MFSDISSAYSTESATMWQFSCRHRDTMKKTTDTSPAVTIQLEDSTLQAGLGRPALGKPAARNAVPVLDDIDVGIIDYLHKDARAPAKAIAETLNVPESTIRSRLARLVDSNVIEFVALTNPLHLGHSVWVMMEIEVVTRRIRQVARELTAIPEIYFVYITTGSFDIFAGATFIDNTEFVDFVTNQLSKVDGIVRVNTRTILEVHKRVFKFRPRASAVRSSKTPRKSTVQTR